MPRDYYALQRTLTTNAASLSGPVGGRFFLFFLLNENALIGVLDNLFFLPKGDGLVVKLRRLFQQLRLFLSRFSSLRV